MTVNIQRDLDGFMAQQLGHCFNVRTFFKQSGCKAVPHGMERYRGFDSSLFQYFMKRTVNITLHQRRAGHRVKHKWGLGFVPFFLPFYGGAGRR